jgi:hypothetical protein
MIAALLLACGGTATLDQPNPPPSPPPALTVADPELVTHTGVVSEVHGATRSFVLTGRGDRMVCVLLPNGTLSLDGKPALVGDLPADTTLTVEGRAEGDLVLVARATTPVADAADAPPAPSQPDAVAPTGGTPPPAAPEPAPPAPTPP